MTGVPLPDLYTLRSRFFPAAIPALALAVVTVSWDSLNLSQLIASLAIGVILVVFSDVARRQGKRVEPRLEARQGGKPSTVFLRHKDGFFDEKTKARFVGFVGKQIGENPPSADDEAADPAAADVFYERV